MQGLESSPLFEEFAETSNDFLNRKHHLDEDLKTRLQPLDGQRIIESKLLDLFMSWVYYPELSKEFNFITFDKLSNDCMKKLLDETFVLTFTGEDRPLELYGKSENNVEITGRYFRQHKSKLDILLGSMSSNEPPKPGVESPLPEKDTLVNLVLRTTQIKITLPPGYFI